MTHLGRFSALTFAVQNSQVELQRLIVSMFTTCGIGAVSCERNQAQNASCAFFLVLNCSFRYALDEKFGNHCLALYPNLPKKLLIVIGMYDLPL